MTQEEIISMAREAGLEAFKYPSMISKTDWQVFERFAKLVAEKEREACAKECESFGSTLANGSMLAEAIRARWQQ